jgi:predicted RNA binding protein YcfA (HicA-like mRNA interferase family)
VAKWSELERYLNKNGWILEKMGDHKYYKKGARRTRISHGGGEVPPPIFRRILRDQLGITLEEFNRNK